MRPMHAAGGVDLLHRHVGRLHGVLAERAEKAGARRQVADLDDVRLGTEIAGKPKMPAAKAAPAPPAIISRREMPLRVIIFFLPWGSFLMMRRN